MKYCKKCLQPDTRPGIKFDDKGVCYACLYEEEKKKIKQKNIFQVKFIKTTWQNNIF